MALLERTRELDALADLVQDGGLLVVEGPAGIGKTTLLRAAGADAAAAGRRVLVARGAQLERTYAYGVARQLFERLVAGDRTGGLLGGAAAAALPAIGGDAAEPDPDPSGFSVLRGLAALTLNAAEAGPLLLVIDDAQWSDEASLRFAGFLARRLDGPDVALCVAIRTGEPDAPEALLDDLRTPPSSRRIAPAPLSATATAAVLRDLAPEVDDRTCARCHEATGGNPLLVREVARAVGGGHDPVQAAAAGIAASVNRRVSAAAPEAERIARAAAVLGDDATLAALSAVTGCDAATCGRATAALAAAGILEGRERYRYTHPLVRAAVLDAMDDGERVRLHRAAALAIEAAGEPDERVVSHLLATPGVGDPAVVDRLRAAAASSIARGDPSSAIRILRRALAEPPPARDRSAVLRELGTAQRLAGDAEGIERLRTAATFADTAAARAEIARELALAQSDLSRYTDAAHTLAAALRDAPDDLDAHIRDALRVDLLAAAMVVPGLDRGRLIEDLSRGTPPEDPAVLAGIERAQLGQCFSRGDPVETWAERLERLLADNPPAADHADVHTVGWWGLVAAERFAVVRRLLDDAEADGPGWTRRRAAVSLVRAQLERRLGELDAAIAVGEAAIEFPTDDRTGEMVHRAQLATAYVERGDLARATTVLEDVRVPPASVEGHLAFVHWGQARLAAAHGDDEAAARAFDAGCAIHHAYEPHAYTRWEDGGADRVACYLRLGRIADARTAVELTLARAEGMQLPGLRGIGLRLRGLLEQDLADLEAAVELLRPSPMRLERARALADLGAELRRRGRRTAAREPLREALDLAHACGARPLAARAREELLLAGARPRRDAHSGRDALTPAELRVATLIAQGATNREVAQALFITQKTAEGHTGRILRKLGLTSRGEVARALGRQAP